MRRLGLLILLFVVPVRAAEVLRVGRDHQNIAITHPGSRHWLIDDRICVYHGATRVVCGNVVRTTPRGAIAKLESSDADVVAGDEVRGAGNRRPTALLSVTEKSDEAKVFDFDITAGLSFSYSFFYPMINFQFAINQNFTIGLAPLYFQASAGSSSLSAFGALATINYYGNEYFRGLWIQGGGGVFFFSGNDGVDPAQSATSPVIMATGGWRGYWDLGLNIGVGAGVQYVSTPSFTNINVKSAGFQPLLVVDVGFNF